MRSRECTCGQWRGGRSQVEFWRGEWEGVVIEGGGGDNIGGVKEEVELEMGEKDEEIGEEGRGRKGY